MRKCAFILDYQQYDENGEGASKDDHWQKESDRHPEPEEEEVASLCWPSVSPTCVPRTCLSIMGGIKRRRHKRHLWPEGLETG